MFFIFLTLLQSGIEKNIKNPNKIKFANTIILTLIFAIIILNNEMIHKEQGRKSRLDRADKLHVKDWVGESISNEAVTAYVFYCR